MSKKKEPEYWHSHDWIIVNGAEPLSYTVYEPYQRPSTITVRLEVCRDPSCDAVRHSKHYYG